MAGKCEVVRVPVQITLEVELPRRSNGRQYDKRHLNHFYEEVEKFATEYAQRTMRVLTFVGEEPSE